MHACLVEIAARLWYTCLWNDVNAINRLEVIAMVIDFHVHAFNPKIAEKAISVLEQRAQIVPYTRGLIEQTVDRMDEWGIDKSVMLPIATKPSQQTVINDWAAQQDSDRIISFGSVHPDAEDAAEELERIKQLGLHGVKLHPDYQGFFINEKRLDPLFDTLERAELPVVFHSGFDVVSPDIIHCTAEAALEMIKRHKHLKAVFAHLGCNECWQDVYDLLAGIDGEVYFDTAFTSRKCPDDMMQRIICKHGADRILFASDMPWDSPALIREKILGLNISDDAKEKILGLNAQRLLGL